MAENKSWRDYLDSVKTGDKSNSNKTETWRDYLSNYTTGSDKPTTGDNSSGGWRDQISSHVANAVGRDIVNRVNNWLQGHNDYVTGYQSRYSDRKWNYEDAYVSDSADWLDSISKQHETSKQEANTILDYLDQNKDYLDAGWVNKVRNAIISANQQQRNLVTGATKDNEWWNNWNNEELVKKYGSAEEAYKAAQREDAYYKTYTGMTSSELSEILAGMVDGEEKDWLTSYRGAVDYDEKSKYDLSAGAKEIEELERAAAEMATISTQYYWATNSNKFSEQEAKEIIAKYNAIVSKYGTPEEIEAILGEKKQYQESAKYIQDVNTMSAVTGNADFDQNSQYVSNVEYGLFGKPEFTDKTYAYINNPTVEDKRALGAGETTARMLIETEDAIYRWDTPTRNLDSSYVKDALDYITEDEIKIYNYYYATEGKEKAEEYLDLLITTFKERKLADAFEKAYKLGSEHPFLGSVYSVATSLGSASEYLGDVVKYGADKLMGKDAKLDKNELAMTTNAIRGSVADKVDWEIGGWDAFDFVYNTTMSGVDSLASKAFGGLGGTVLGLSAAAQGTNDALDRGMSDGQAFWNGLFSGVFEGIFESISIGNFNRLKEIAPNGLKDIIKNLGKSMLVNASEETMTEIANIAYDTLVNGEFANYTMEELKNGAWKQALNQVIEAGASGALMGMGMSAVGSSIGNATANKQAKAEYGGKTDTLIQEGLKNDITSKSYQLATKYKQKVDGKDGKKGKALTGQQIRKLVAANEEQFKANDYNDTVSQAKTRFAELGETGNVEELAQLAAKRATGQDLTRAEKRILANSQFGSKVAKELKDAKEGKTTVYKSLEERAGTESKLSVSESGQAEINGETVSLKKAEVKEFVKDKTGKITDMVIEVDGKTVKASEIDYADGDQSYLFYAVSKIENISPRAATAIIRDYDPSSGQTVGEYLNGIDEGFTYGYYGYSEADLKAGNFAPKLTEKQMKTAYELGRFDRENSGKSKTEAYKNMRTAAQAEAEKAVAEGKEAPKDKNLTITYNEGGGKVVSIDKAGIKDAKRSGAVEVAKILHKLGLGTKVEFFKSYLIEDENGNEIRVFKDDNGVEQRAYSGVYRKSDGTIRIDLDAYNGRGLTLNALSHELTHFIQQWSEEKYKVLADFLIKAYEKTDMTMHERVLREQARLEGIRGESVSYDEAFDEVVANAMSKMFDDGKLVERLTELKAQDEKLARKLWQGFKKILAKFLGIYEESEALFHDTADLMAMKDTFEQLQNMFAEAMVEASENYQASQQIGLEIDAETESVSPAVMHSEHTWTESDYVQERDKAAKEIAKAIGVSQKKAKDYIDSINSIAKMIAEDRSRLDYFSSPGRTSFVGNVEYGGSFDFSTLCKKRRLLTGTFTAIQKALPNTALTADEILDIRNRMKKAGLEVSCGLCYVEGSRANMGQFAKEFLRLYKQYYPDAWQPNMADVNTPDGIEWVRINHPECYEQYEYFWNHYGTLKEGDKNLFASQQKPKLYQLHTEYKGEILQKFKGDDNVEAKNLNGGIRLQSFSDFEIVHLIDTMQIIMDMSRVGLAGQAYTKVPDFAWALGDTGLKINLSLIAKGVDADGKLIFDDVEGMPIAEAMKLRDRYSKNVGTILVAFNDQQLLAAMADDRVDFIIPFHRSQWKKSQYEAMGLPAKTKDYTFMQNEKFIKPQFHEYRGRMVQDKATNYMPNEYWDFTKSGKENADAYLEMCARNNKRPKFYKLLENNGDGSYSLKADGSTDGYWKLLIDFKMYDNDGVGSPQMAVKPEFNMEEANRMLNDYKGGHSNFPVAQGIVDGFVKDYKASHKGEQYSSQETDADIDRIYIEYGDISSEKGAIDNTVARLVSQGKFVEITADDVEKHKTSGEWDSRKGARQYLKRILKGFLGKSVRFNRNIVRAEAYLTKEGFNHSAVGLNTPQKAAAFSKYYALIANSEYSYSSKNDIHSNANTRIGGKIDWDSFVAVAMIEGEPYPVVFKVRTIDNDIRSQIYRMATKNEIGSTHDYGQQNDLPDALPNYGGTPISGDKVSQKMEEVKSEHDTDYSNRALLANAFEGITNGSEEYKLIQRYKGHIAELNSLENRLSEMNAEIRKLQYGKGADRNAEKLRRLEGEAEKIAEAINSHDRKLVSLEASEPLRKIIEREREKASKKTKEHIEEIQQNKMARAEQTELRHKIRKTVRDLDKLLKRGNKQRNVKEDMKGFVSKALELADYLFTDHISNDDLIRNGITVRMSPREAAIVKETEDILSQLYDNIGSLTPEEYAQLDAKRKRNMDKLRDLLTSQRNERLNVPVYNLFNDIVTEYASLKNSKQDAVKAAYDPNVERFLREYMGESNGETDSDRKSLLQNMRVADMTTKELQHLLYAYTMVMTSVRDANKLHIKGKTETIEQMAGRIMSDFSGRKTPDGKVKTVLRNLSNKIGWDYEKLYYALDRIGSEAFTELVMNIANSENIVMQDVMEAAAFRDEMVKNYGFNNWDVNKKIDREFMDNTGKKFKLTLGQMMALYAYSRRKGAWDHIEYGGFVFGDRELTNPKPADSYKLSKAQCEAITNLLTKEQKGYVEAMQKFLSETMGAKGNEVSMQLYGIKMFTEKNYFPIHIAGQFKAQANESQAKAAAGFSSMSNAGFTHAQNPNAKAPFVLEGFNDVWADHVNEMSRYHGTVPALEDMRKVMNRSFYSESTAESLSIKQMMENSFGKEAVDYFDNLYKEANSGAITDKLQKKSKKLLSLFRKNSVAYSLSVLVQQPASLVRAYAMIDRKYFGFKGVGAISSGVAKAVFNKLTKAHTNAYNEMLKYAPGVTMAKEIGGFDTATGGSIRSYLLDTNKSFKQKWKTGTIAEKGKAVMDVVDDNAIANLPNVADKIAWIEIWNACKRETAAKHKDLATSSEEFMQLVGERFTEVIRATQVYDSIFGKSPMLKSKNLAVQYLVSFMNEPNTTANMVEKAMRDVTKGNWKSGVRTATVVVHSIIFTNVLKSIIYAMRDDDEDETYIEKYLESITGNMMNDFNPLNYIPIARDVWSLAQGYDVERADMAIVADALDALGKVIKNGFTDTDDMTEEQLIEFDKKVTESNWKLVESIASFFGIPVKNIRREVEGVIDHARIASANAGMTTPKSSWDKIYDAVIDSIPFMPNKHTKTDKLYEAIIIGDKPYLERLKSAYKDDDAYHSAVRKALRESDPRIHEAAQARYDGNTEEYKRIFREIKDEGKFSFDDIMSAVNSEESAIRNKLEPEKATSSYTANGFVEAVAMGNATEAQAMKAEIVATKVANGKTQEEAEKEFASDVATGIGKAYSSGLLDEAQAERMLQEYAGKDADEAASKVSYWAFCEEHPQYKDVFTESHVGKYHEFAEPENISVDVYAQFITGTKGLETIYDKWGDVEVTKREQVLEVIDSMPLTWQQKDALYLAAGYSESKIWDVPW